MGDNPGFVTAEEHRRRVAESDVALARLRAERDALDGRIESWEARRERSKADAARSDFAATKRSQLSPQEKARIIQEHGRAFYEQLPYK